MKYPEWIDAILPKASKEDIEKALPQLLKDADEEAKIMAQIDPIAHPMGEA